TYLIDRCQGEGCGDFRQVGTSASTLYRDNRLSPLTSYTYRVHATDAAGNIGDYSNLASAITAAFTDAQPPTTPGNLTAMAASSSRIDLSWIASTDDVGVAGYAIERCQGAGCTSFTLVGTSTTPGFSNTG